MSAYSDRVIADGASYYWRLGDTSGTVAAAVVGGAPGTISGGVTLNQPGALADGNPSMLFNGTTGTIRTTSVTIPLAATIEFWFKRTTVPDGPLLSSRGAGSSGNVVYAGFQGGALMIFSTAVSLGAKLFTGDGVWHHVAIVLTGTTCTFYADGVQDGSASAQTRTTPSTGPFDFARDEPNATFFPGSLDEVAIYPTALSAATIAAHYQLALSALRPDLPFWTLIAGDDPMMIPFNRWVAVTPSDTVDLPLGTSEGLWVSGGGDVSCLMQDGTIGVFAAVPAGCWLPIATKRVRATGTTATNITVLYQI